MSASLHQTALPVLTTAPERSFAIRACHAGRDLLGAARLWRLCLALAWMDIKARYRGSMLGPFWVTASTAVMIVSLGILYAALFHMEMGDYLPFLSLSLVLWGYLATVTTEACTCFTSDGAAIRARRAPFLLHVARMAIRNVIVFAHNIVVIVAVFVVFHVVPGPAALWCIPGLALWLLDTVAIGVLLGMLGARFRDIPPIVGSVLQIAFFISPVIWKPNLIPHAQAWIGFNPFFSLLEIVRQPLLGHAVPGMLWALAGGYSVVLCAGAALLFMRVRCRLAYWV